MRVISSSGDTLGILAYKEALNIAKRQNLDLIEINPASSPPVCKIADYGKMMYEKAKRAKTNKQARPAQEKTIRIKPNIGANDLHRKIACVKKFLDKGHRVSVQVILRGRYRAYPEKAREIVSTIQNEIDYAIVGKPKYSQNGVIVQFSKRP